MHQTLNNSVLLFSDTNQSCKAFLEPFLSLLSRIFSSPFLFSWPINLMKITWSALHLSCPNTGRTPPAKGFIDAEISCHTCFVLLSFLHVHKLLSIRNFPGCGIPWGNSVSMFLFVFFYHVHVSFFRLTSLDRFCCSNCNPFLSNI